MRFNETFDVEEGAKIIRNCLKLYGMFIASQHRESGIVAVHFPGEIQPEKHAGLSAASYDTMWSTAAFWAGRGLGRCKHSR